MTPTSVPVAGTEDLKDALESQLATAGRLPTSITRFERRPSKFSTSHPIENIRIRFSDGSILDVIFKNLDPDSMLEEARATRPTFFIDPLREIETYRTILSPAGIGPELYGAVQNAKEGRHWLFLEKVRGMQLAHVGEFTAWTETAAWLSQVHVRFKDEALALLSSAPLIHYGANWFETWSKRAQSALTRRGGAVALDIAKRLARRYTGAIDFLTSLPVTFIHGEFYASNVLVASEQNGQRTCPVDWEMAAVASGLFDLAALTTGSWTPQQVESMAAAYAGHDISMTETMRALSFCRLHLCLQWIGWAMNWSPPAEHSQDWVGTAHKLMDELDL